MWVGISESRTTLASANTAVLIAVGNAALLALRPFTIVRTRLFFGVSSDQAAASQNWDVALGAAIVSDQASAIGITAVPTPFTDLGSDLFFLHEIQANRFVFVSGVGFDPNGAPLGRPVDSKAMRKVNDDQDVAFVLENSSLSNGTTVYVAGRMLIKLH